MWLTTATSTFLHIIAKQLGIPLVSAEWSEDTSNLSENGSELKEMET